MITDLTFPYLLREPTKKAASPKMLLLLHGFGSNERDLFSFANTLPAELHVVAPRAPYSVFHDGFAWYDIDLSRGVKFTNAEQAVRSVEGLHTFIKALQERYGILPKNFYMGGFSQGAIMSYGVGINYPAVLRGLVALSGYVLKDYIPETIDRKAVSKLRIFARHGTADEVIPVRMGQMGKEFMEALGVSVNYGEYPVGHGVPPEGLQALVQWLNEALAD